MGEHLNGFGHIIGRKLFTRKAEDCIVMDRAIYDLAHFTVGFILASRGQEPPPWGEELTLRRPIGNGKTINTTIMLPPDDIVEPAGDAAAPPAANDDDDAMLMCVECSGTGEGRSSPETACLLCKGRGHHRPADG